MNEFGKIYELVPSLALKFIGKNGLIAVAIGGSYSIYSWKPDTDIDVDLIFKPTLNPNFAITIAKNMRDTFQENKLDLDVRLCGDTDGNVVYLHDNSRRLLQHPAIGTVENFLASYSNSSNIILPSNVDLTSFR